MDLFGKKEIAALEKTVAELEEQLAKAERERKKYREKFQQVETEKQEAYEERNKLRDKLRTLQEQTRGGEERNARVLSLDELQELVEALAAPSFGTAAAHTAYLPPEKAIVSDESEILFFDTYATAIALVPPIPVMEEVAVERRFRLEQLQSLLKGPYCYLHLSPDGAGIARLRSYTVDEFRLLEGPESVEQIREELDALSVSEDRFLVAGTAPLADTVADELDADRVQSKVAGVSRENDLERAFETAFQFRHIRLTAQDIREVKQRLFS